MQEIIDIVKSRTASLQAKFDEAKAPMPVYSDKAKALAAEIDKNTYNGNRDSVLKLMEILLGETIPVTYKDEESKLPEVPAMVCVVREHNTYKVIGVACGGFDADGDIRITGIKIKNVNPTEKSSTITCVRNCSDVRLATPEEIDLFFQLEGMVM